MNAIQRAEGTPDWSRDVNRIAAGLLGQEPGAITLLKDDRSGPYFQVSEAGMIVNAPTAFNAGINIRGGGPLLAWNIANTNSVNWRHSETNDIWKTDDGLWVAGAIGAGVNPSAHAAGDVVANATLKWKSSGAAFIGLAHAATVPRVWTFQDTTDTVVGRDTFDTLTNKILTSPTVNGGTVTGAAISGGTITGSAISGGTIAGAAISGGSIANAALSGTFTGDHVYSGTVTFSHATVPIITARIGPANTQQHVIPATTPDTVVLAAFGQTLAGKTLTAPTINSGALSGTLSGNVTLSGQVTFSNTTSAIQAASGSATQPSITFAAGTAEGLHWISAGRVGISAGGARIVEVVNAGATVGVGIGMTPSVALDVTRFSTDYVARIAQTNSAAGARVLSLVTANTSASDYLLNTEAGGIARFQVYSNGGCMVGAPTGGNKGNGTINVSGGLYFNGALTSLVDYAFEHHFTGEVREHAAAFGADSYPGLQPLDEVRDYAREHWQLPRVSERQELFSRVDMLLEKLEEVYMYLWDHNDRLRALESGEPHATL